MDECKPLLLGSLGTVALDCTIILQHRWFGAEGGGYSSEGGASPSGADSSGEDKWEDSDEGDRGGGGGVPGGARRGVRRPLLLEDADSIE